MIKKGKVKVYTQKTTGVVVRNTIPLEEPPSNNEK